MIVLCMYSHCILSFVHFRTGIFGGINDLGEGEPDLHRLTFYVLITLSNT